MNVEPLHDLCERWLDEAETFDRRGLDDAASMARSYAGELDDAIHAWRTQSLTLQEAAEESGYAYSTLQQRVAEGKIPNAGESGSPRIRRCDLPTRPNHPSFPGAASQDGPDIAAELRETRLAS